MKKIFAAILASLVLIACSEDKPKNEAISDEQVSFRKGNLSDEADAMLPEANFSSAMPGESTLIDRSYENAPPLISHSVEDMLPITKDNNMCLSCHDKAIAADIGATSMPMTHYFDYQANKATGDAVSNERFNCTLCHVPQSNAKPLVGNTFKPEFESEALKKKSNLIDTINEGIK